MRDAAYARRLAEDVPKWRAAGWVTEAGAAAILAAGGERRSALSMASIIGTIGALLIGLGIIAFIGANWEGIPRLYRFGLLILGLAIAYLASGLFSARGYRVFSEAALLLAGLVFAAAIALIGQTYHLAGDFMGAVLLWEVGMIGAALLTGSSVMTMLAVIGAGYWLWLATVENDVLPHWQSLAVILVGGAIATLLDARYSRVVAILAFGFWVTVTTIAYATRLDLPFAGTMALLATAALAVWAIGAALAGAEGRSRIGALGVDMQWPALAALLVALGLLQTVTFWGEGTRSQLWVMPAFILGVGAVRPHDLRLYPPSSQRDRADCRHRHRHRRHRLCPLGSARRPRSATCRRRNRPRRGALGHEPRSAAPRQEPRPVRVRRRGSLPLRRHPRYADRHGARFPRRRRPVHRACLWAVPT